MRKKLLSALLAVCMALTLLPGAALAEEGEERYFRSTLTDGEGKIYDAFVNDLEAVRSGKAVKVEKAAILDVRRAVLALNRDFPELFWLGSGYDIRYGSSGADIAVPYSASWAGGDRKIAADQTAVSSAAAAIVKEAKKAATPAAQLRYVHDWLTKNNQYNTSVSEADTDSAPFSAVSALDAKLSPVCEGYSRAFKLICDELEIPCILVSGTGTDNQNKAVDVTWDDPVAKGGKGSNGTDTYFLVGRNTKNDAGRTFASSHKNDADLTYPALSAEKYTPATG